MEERIGRRSEDGPVPFRHLRLFFSRNGKFRKGHFSWLEPLNRRVRTLLTLLLQDAAKPRFYATLIAVASTGAQLEAGTHFYTLPSVKVPTDPRLCGKTAPPNAGLPLLLQSAVTLPRR